mmetsp:Transcript_62196/g.183919  ORF Transcript_62196/g.183919 Transcript_62196/m.183919 type:complete len:275 (-) Transcript_62196:186-1010(-)
MVGEREAIVVGIQASVTSVHSGPSSIAGVASSFASAVARVVGAGPAEGRKDATAGCSLPPSSSSARGFQPGVAVAIAATSVRTPSLVPTSGAAIITASSAAGVVPDIIIVTAAGAVVLLVIVSAPSRRESKRASVRGTLPCSRPHLSAAVTSARGLPAPAPAPAPPAPAPPVPLLRVLPDFDYTVALLLEVRLDSRIVGMYVRVGVFGVVSVVGPGGVGGWRRRWTTSSCHDAPAPPSPLSTVVRGHCNGGGGNMGLGKLPTNLGGSSDPRTPD